MAGTHRSGRTGAGRKARRHIRRRLNKKHWLEEARGVRRGEGNAEAVGKATVIGRPPLSSAFAGPPQPKGFSAPAGKAAGPPQPNGSLATTSNAKGRAEGKAEAKVNAEGKGKAAAIAKAAATGRPPSSAFAGPPAAAGGGDDDEDRGDPGFSWDDHLFAKKLKRKYEQMARDAASHAEPVWRIDELNWSAAEDRPHAVLL